MRRGHQVLSVPGSEKGEVTALRPTADQRSKYTPTLQANPNPQFSVT
eukprot:COSAG02_NODE_53767_length_299_cov_7.785000_1_plen_46_part_10